MSESFVNPVENYLQENSKKSLSLRTIYRDLKLRRRETLWLIHKSKNIANVAPLTVGSNKSFMHVYKYSENTCLKHDMKKHDMKKHKT